LNFSSSKKFHIFSRISFFEKLSIRTPRIFIKIQ
jgi:hypothetical protein